MKKYFCDMCGKDCGEFYKNMTAIRIEPYEPLRDRVDHQYDVCKDCAEKVNNFIKRKGLEA